MDVGIALCGVSTFRAARKVSRREWIAVWRVRAWRVQSVVLASDHVDPEDPRCADGGEACADCLCRGACLIALPVMWKVKGE